MPKTLLRVVAVLTVSWLVLMASLTKFDRSGPDGGPAPPLPQDIASPIAAVELARSAQDLTDTLDVGARHGNRAAMMLNTRLDFGFIVLYWGLFFGIALLMRQMHAGGWPAFAAYLAMGTVSIAAAADIFENVGIFHALSAPAFTDELARSIREPSLVKWMFFFATFALLALPVAIGRIAGSLRWLPPVAGGLLAIAGGIGFVAVLSLPRLLIYVWPCGALGLTLLLSTLHRLTPERMV